MGERTSCQPDCGEAGSRPLLVPRNRSPSVLDRLRRERKSQAGALDRSGESGFPVTPPKVILEGAETGAQRRVLPSGTERRQHTGELAQQRVRVGVDSFAAPQRRLG